jgi:hypothetical protein
MIACTLAHLIELNCPLRWLPSGQAELPKTDARCRRHNVIELRVVKRVLPHVAEGHRATIPSRSTLPRSHSLGCPTIRSSSRNDIHGRNEKLFSLQVFRPDRWQSSPRTEKNPGYRCDISVCDREASPICVAHFQHLRSKYSLSLARKAVDHRFSAPAQLQEPSAVIAAEDGRHQISVRAT